MTDLESPRKNNDCYFYYYSTCTKGDSCTFRHEPSALGCEDVCSFWKEGKCVNVHCNFRHMELRKNRKAIQCYWETQPGGCKKSHCPFMHASGGGNIDEIDEKSEMKKEFSKNQIANADKIESPEKAYPVDSLVVNFEEESDNESAPTNSPIKNIPAPRIKTLEEIKLEKIQAESAAFYSYPGAEEISQLSEDDLRARLLQKMNRKIPSLPTTILPQDTQSKKRQAEENINSALDELIPKNKRQKTEPKPSKPQKDVASFKIKTLAEIRAERMQKMNPSSLDENMVTSTSIDGETIETPPTDVKPTSPRKKIKLRRLLPEKEDIVETTCTTESSSRTEPELEPVAQTECGNVTFPTERTKEQDIEILSEKSRSSSMKTLDESVLLLDDDEEMTNVSLKGEDELLDELDALLDD